MPPEFFAQHARQAATPDRRCQHNAWRLGSITAGLDTRSDRACWNESESQTTICHAGGGERVDPPATCPATRGSRQSPTARGGAGRQLRRTLAPALRRARRGDAAGAAAACSRIGAARAHLGADVGPGAQDDQEADLLRELQEVDHIRGAGERVLVGVQLVVVPRHVHLPRRARAAPACPAGRRARRRPEPPGCLHSCTRDSRTVRGTPALRSGRAPSFAVAGPPSARGGCGSSGCCGSHRRVSRCRAAPPGRPTQAQAGAPAF
jgi:hypothetical protein